VLFLATQGQGVSAVLGPLLSVSTPQSVLYNTIMLIFLSLGVMLQYLQDGASQAIKRIQILQSEYLEVQRGQRVER